ncbi:MAG TPA: hypothetical protein VEG34_03220 [Thermoanaerobaculia bacterium]|nr:hypothetical protein [Thermoanaerobaculia bacterium]
MLGTELRCHGLPADLGAEVGQLLRGFPSADGDPAALELVWEGFAAASSPSSSNDAVRPERPVLADSRGERWALDPEVAFASQVEYRVISDALRAARNRYILHAGAVAGVAGASGAGGTCLLIGDSGVGKTSLTLWLWSSGLRLATDDLCTLDATTLEPEVFPRALHFDGVYAPELLARIPPRPADYPADYYPFPGRPGVPQPPLPPITGLLVLERGPRPEGEVEPLTRAEAAHHLLRAVIKGEQFRFDRALSDMLRLSERFPAFRLKSATPEGAAAQALATLGRLGITPA